MTVQNENNLSRIDGLFKIIIFHIHSNNTIHLWEEGNLSKWKNGPPDVLCSELPLH